VKDLLMKRTVYQALGAERGIDVSLRSTRQSWKDASNKEARQPRSPGYEYIIVVNLFKNIAENGIPILPGWDNKI
jgi:hypothetical protein